MILRKTRVKSEEDSESVFFKWIHKHYRNQDTVEHKPIPIVAPTVPVKMPHSMPCKMPRGHTPNKQVHAKRMIELNTAESSMCLMSTGTAKSKASSFAPSAKHCGIDGEGDQEELWKRHYAMANRCIVPQEVL